MKVPTYITKEQLKKSRKLFDDVAKQQGLHNAMIAKKLMLVAMYGTMIKNKISYEDFIGLLTRRLEIKENIKSFWDLTKKAQQNNYVFCIKADIILNGTLAQVELEIVKLYNNLINNLKELNYRQAYIKDSMVKTHLQDYYKQMFNK